MSRPDQENSESLLVVLCLAFGVLIGAVGETVLVGLLMTLRDVCGIM